MTPKKKEEEKLHPGYERFLRDQGHVKESTLRQTRAKLRGFPEPDKLGAKWLRKRMKQKSKRSGRTISAVTLRREKVLMKRVMLFLKRKKSEIEALDAVKMPRIEDSVTVADLYTAQELDNILKACQLTRDVAMYQVLYESAVRASELLDMKFENVHFNEDNTASIIISGKTGTREIPIYQSVPALKAWMKVHPTQKGHIWIISRKPFRVLKYGGLYTITKRIIARAGFKRDTKKILHMFRHTRATELVRLGVRGQSLLKVMGWTKRSNMEAVYVHLSTDDVNNEMRSKVFELDTEEEREVQRLIVSKTCPRCTTPNDNQAWACEKCNFPLSNDAIVQAMKHKNDRDAEIENLKASVETLHIILKNYHSINEALQEYIRVSDPEAYADIQKGIAQGRAEAKRKTKESSTDKD